MEGTHTMTELLQRAIEMLQALPEPRQDELASRILARFAEEQRMETELLVDFDEGAADAGDVVDGEQFMGELRTKIEARQ